MASKENFFKAHWDWLAMGGGVAVLAASLAVLMGRLGVSPEDGAMRCEMRLKAAKPAHEGVAPADMTIFNSVLRTAKVPPSMMEIDPLKGSFLASGTRIVCKAEKDAVGADGKPVKGCGRPVPIDMKACPYCLVVQDTGITKEEEGVKRMREWSARYGVDVVKNPDVDSDKDGFTFVLPTGTALDAFAAPSGYAFRAASGDAYRLDESPSGIVYSADAYRSFVVDTVGFGPDRSVKRRNEIPPFAYSGDAWKGSASAASSLTFTAEDGTTAHSESCTGTGTFAYELPKGLWTVTLSSSATNLVANINFINGFIISLH